MKSKNYRIITKSKRTVLNAIIDDIMKLYEPENDNYLADDKNWKNHKPFNLLFR
ncbi:hypothetical protein ACFL20_05505 [Spirochaetota bacterium]